MPERNQPEKDPAFLFYPQKWLEGTAELSATARGVYINLLAHQHQKKGALPNNFKVLARLGGVSETEFEELWRLELATKFQQKDDKVFNNTLNNISNKRATTAIARKIAGKLSMLLRSVSHLPPQVSEEIRTRFKSENFSNCAEPLLDGLLTDWFNVCLKSIININTDINKDVLKEGGSGEGKFNQWPVAEHFNGIPDININQAIQLVDITKKVQLSKDDVVGLWEIFKVKNLTGKKFYQSKGDVYSHFIDSLKYQIFDNGTKTNQRTSSRSDRSAIGVNHAINAGTDAFKKFAARGKKDG